MSETTAHALEGMKGGATMDLLPAGLTEVITHCLEGLALLIDFIGIGFILFGFVIAMIRLIGGLSHGIGLRKGLGNLNSARAVLGVYILTGLEFMIASDIIHTVVTREITDLIFVGLLVLIRTAISFFLGKEIMELTENRDEK